ncbi:MAG: hypothetical protein IOC39_25980 [Burkholderia sp.]|jgi:hypothetical protein|uniref:hypothetical protein n=1 Tax=Burkholderia TaxID=32008 RepID=UPI00158A3BE7|nr:MULTISPECIES: hypothetical protein [Burkholderia]MCA3776761.1 hypothetical protein [Burkholderia sp.]MCA3783483.1 hypothetical protein [Burkholderia sp.]MCA3794613.1 hypothetical protein [Burkholderia sp.]MCA3812699.1 hypothetical protein [Burkholderia sp.]MCA3819273.1 hypothetical protein [Burkholderia sp.]
MKTILSVAALCAALTGCISVYGPGQRYAARDAPPEKHDTADGASDASGASSTEAASRIVIGNRKYDEVWAAVAQFYADHKLAVRVSDRDAGLVAAAYTDYPNAGNFLDCSELKQTSNVTHTLKVVTRIDEATQGVTVSIDVAGIAGVVAAGKQKGARVACRSNGTLEQTLTEVLRK